MAGISQKEYNNQVDEALVLFGGGAPCCSIDPRLWGSFKELYKEFNDTIPRSAEWAFDQVVEWMDEFQRVKLEQAKNL